ncbi:acyl-CoA N-acyltransferase [Phlyctochytrium arcticum]|nr:acyl-CoA N-acyltransferase [Phlyctochytrium arcticum]
MTGSNDVMKHDFPLQDDDVYFISPDAQDRKVTRRRSKILETSPPETIDATESTVKQAVDEQNERKNIDYLQYGPFLLTPWYFSPYRINDQVVQGPIFTCHFCMKYMNDPDAIRWHQTRCTEHQIPGKQIYQQDDTKVYEVEGRIAKIFCQNLCLLAKLFLNNKSIFYDVHRFLFYVLVAKGQDGRDYIMGYFSKEIQSFQNFNLACILVLPPFQRMGWGTFLIELSYELSKRLGQIGSPERPLSDLGLASYKSYWRAVVLDILGNNCSTSVAIGDIARLTGIHEQDILLILFDLNLTHQCCHQKKSIWYVDYNVQKRIVCLNGLY